MPSILNFSDISQSDWNALVDRAVAHYRRGKQWTDVAKGKSIGLVFMNSSLRTRTSMELAAAQLGAHVTTLVSGEGVWGFEWTKGAVMDGDTAEHITEAVGVLSRYYDALGIRAFASKTDYEADKSDAKVRMFADIATVPVINLESAWFHPCQALADAAAIRATFETRKTNKFVLSWAYHPRALPMAVPNSALLMAAHEGFDVIVASPDTHTLDPDIVSLARKIATSNGGSVSESSDLNTAAEDAVVIYAKAWGGRAQYDDPVKEQMQREANRNWRITEDVMRRTADGKFMHCLPVRRNVIVDDAVIDGPSAIHLLQAEMRLHGQKALLERMWGV